MKINENVYAELLESENPISSYQSEDLTAIYDYPRARAEQVNNAPNSNQTATRITQAGNSVVVELPEQQQEQQVAEKKQTKLRQSSTDKMSIIISLLVVQILAASVFNTAIIVFLTQGQFISKTVNSTVNLQEIDSIQIYSKIKVIDTHWLLWNCSNVSQSDFSGLFVIIGATYGDRKTTLNLPDCKYKIVSLHNEDAKEASSPSASDRITLSAAHLSDDMKVPTSVDE
jgi:hypothetical protein